MAPISQGIRPRTRLDGTTKLTVVTRRGEGSAAADGNAERPKKLAIQVREQLLAEMWAGRWRPGDHLPTEPELMERFGVSRAPIREAMQSLHLLGIVDISPRRGAYVRALPVQSVVDLAILSGIMGPEHTVADVFEFRHAMEGAIGELAATNAAQADLDRIAAVLRDNAEAVARGDFAEARRIDVLFHAAIAEASGNVVFSAVVTSLNRLLSELRRKTGGIPGASEASLVEHHAILAALERCDPAAAREASQRHVQNTRARYASTARAPAEVAPPT